MYRLLLSLLSLSTVHAAALPPCAYEDRHTPLTSYSDWPYTPLDMLFKLPQTYAPDDLVSVSDAGVGTEAMYIRGLVMPDLRALLTAATAAGVHLEVQSAYRGYSYQAQTFDSWVAQDGHEVALKSSARAGHSEHQLGTALDFRSADGPPAWDLDDWGATREGSWMAHNASRFGFVMSYPRGKDAVAWTPLPN